MNVGTQGPASQNKQTSALAENAILRQTAGTTNGIVAKVAGIQPEAVFTNGEYETEMRSYPKKIVIVFGLFLPVWASLHLLFWNTKPCWTAEDQIDSVRHMIHAWDRLMTEQGLVHWLDFGSLLGARRFGDCIPWDHDGDVAYMWKDVWRVSQDVAPKLKRLGIQMDPTNPVQMTHNGTAVDVFAYATYLELHLPLPPGQTEMSLTRATYRHSTLLESAFSDVETEQILPTSRCRFAGQWVSCPNAVDQVLSKHYPIIFSLHLNIPFKVQCYLNPLHFLRILVGWNKN